MEEKQTKTRKPHKKSRSGCLPCKARHVKCDELKPACVNCDKYGSKCEYPPAKKRRVSSDTPMSTPSSTEALNISQPTPLFTPALLSPSSQTVVNISHLRLLHHFTTVTAMTLAAEPEAEEIYQSYMLKIAFEYPFLLQAILAVSALHLSRLNQQFRTEYLRQAEMHHSEALSQFRNDVQDIDERNFRPVFFFSAILFPYSCALPIDRQSTPEHMLDMILQILALTRRVRPMVGKFYTAMLNSELNRVVPRDTRYIDWDDVPRLVDSELVSLRKFAEVIQHIYPPDVIAAYGDAIRVLDIIFARAAGKSPSDSLVKVWVHFVSPRFLDLLSEGSPGALIVFAHYAVLFHRSRQYWFFDGVAEQILHVVDTLVPGEWKSWLDWPREQILGVALN